MRITTVALAALFLAPGLARAAGHPRVLYGEADVPTLQARAETSHAVILGSLRKGTDEFVGSSVSSSGLVTWTSGRTFSLGDNRDIGYSLMVWAFTWQLTGQQQYLDLARTWLLNAASWSTWDLSLIHI